MQRSYVRETVGNYAQEIGITASSATIDILFGNLFLVPLSVTLSVTMPLYKILTEGDFHNDIHGAIGIQKEVLEETEEFIKRGKPREIWERLYSK